MRYGIICKDCPANDVAEQTDKRGWPVLEVIQELRAKGLLDDHAKRYPGHRVEVTHG